MAQIRHLYPISGPIPQQVSEKEHMVTVRDGSQIRVRVYVPGSTALEWQQSVDCYVS